MRYLSSLAMGLFLFPTSLLANPDIPKVPNYADATPMFIQEVDSSIKNGVIRVSVIRTYDLNKEDDKKFDVLTFSARCHYGVNGRIKEYVLGVKDVINERMFLYDVFGSLMNVIEGNENIDNYYGDLPDCPI